MKATKKEIIKLAAYEYMKQYWRDIAIYDALKAHSVYVNIEGSLEDAYLEQLFNKVSPLFTEILLNCQTKEEIDELFDNYNDEMEIVKWED